MTGVETSLVKEILERLIHTAADGINQNQFNDALTYLVQKSARTGENALVVLKHAVNRRLADLHSPYRLNAVLFCMTPGVVARGFVFIIRGSDLTGQAIVIEQVNAVTSTP